MLNPSPAIPPTSPRPPARPTRAYTTLFWFLVLGQVLATFTALMAVGTLLATARPVVRWRVTRPPVVTTIPTDPSGWQTYRNEEFGLEFQYPGAWIINKEVVADPNVLMLLRVISEGGEIFSVSVRNDPQYYGGFRLLPGQRDKIMIDRISADRLTFEGGDVEGSGYWAASERVLLTNKDLIFEFYIDPPSANSSELNRIVQSIKFLTK